MSAIPPTPPTDKGSGPLSRGYLIALLLVLGGVFLYMTRMFFLPVVMAAVFAGLFHPLHHWLAKKMPSKRNLPALLATLVLILGLLIPLYVVGTMVAIEAINLYDHAEDLIRPMVEAPREGGMFEPVTDWIMNGPLSGLFDRIDLDLEQQLANLARTTGKVVIDVANQTGRTTFQIVINLFIMLFTMFFFFRDGSALMKRLFYYSPLPQQYEDQLVERFLEVSRATVKGTLVIGLIQGALGLIPLLVFGVPSAILLGVIMVILSVIPMVGGYIVLYPAAAYLIISGDIWQGIVLIVWTVVVVTNVDNLIRPRLVGQDAKMHDLLILFSTIGGIAMFGVLGFIVGPILAAFLVTMLEIYGSEFRSQLAFASAGESEPPPLSTAAASGGSEDSDATNDRSER